jgi:hypothetical protein
MELLLFNAFNGLIQGVFYALMALGLALILSHCCPNVERQGRNNNLIDKG